jgi:predicted  nucleic acid-binding Zn-ribbon protein
MLRGEVFALAFTNVESGVSEGAADAAKAHANASDAEEMKKLEAERVAAAERRAKRRERMKEVADRAAREQKAKKEAKAEPAVKPKKRLLVVD